MNCPKCNGATKVTDARSSQYGTYRRRRECLQCGDRFTTYESSLQNALPNTNKYNRKAPAVILQDPARSKFVELAGPFVQFMQFHFPDAFSKELMPDLSERAVGWLNSIKNDE